MLNKFLTIFLLLVSVFRTYGQLTPEQMSYGNITDGDGAPSDSTDQRKEVLTMVEKMPIFPGGEQAMLRFLSDSLRYPEEARNKNIQGKVYVRFIVTPAGDVSNVEVIRGLPEGLSEEAIRVVKLMPKWIPGSQFGKNVPVQFTLPISFVLK